MSHWTDDQLQMLALTWSTKTDLELAETLSAVGPPKNHHAVAEQRYRMELMKPRGFEQPFAGRRAAEVARERVREATSGWPVMRGTPEDREARYLTLLFEGLKEEQRRIAAKMVAA